ncbi:AAA family ATPase [Akkermansia muciniphila]|uniref:Uncharacterized protein n=1 Tax=Akkermansia muciniphila TaxID=239935 RepID=A0AAP8T8T5_9BACT|nr:AAA family ATPase [Akkermansia muciniphila]PNC54626.1 hypothetical protein CXU09_08745 [Akkermansia muciniphila]
MNQEKEDFFNTYGGTTQMEQSVLTQQLSPMEEKESETALPEIQHSHPIPNTPISISPLPLDSQNSLSTLENLFYSPEELASLPDSPDNNLVGEGLFQRETLVVICGPGGVGKSRASTSLAVMGAIGTGQWFGLEVKHQYRTLIVQSENTLNRLKSEFSQIPDRERLQEWIRVSRPPMNGLDMKDSEFIETLEAQIHNFQPDVIVWDPWSDIVESMDQKAYSEGIKQITRIVAKAELPKKPVTVIIAHTRKNVGEKLKLSDLGGSGILGTRARAVFGLRRIQDRILFSVLKANDTPPNIPIEHETAWFYNKGQTMEDTEFEIQPVHGKAISKKEQKRSNQLHVLSAVGIGSKQDFVDALRKETQCSQSTAYEAIKSFMAEGILRKENDKLTYSPVDN